MDHVRDLSRVADIYSTLKEMRLENHEMVDVLAKRVWDMRSEWMVDAYVPEKDQAERFAWIYPLLLCIDDDEEEDGG